ncbi:MAG: hypothetical protein RLZZ273_1101 [Bacteroidota bacterium]
MTPSQMSTVLRSSLHACLQQLTSDAAKGLAVEEYTSVEGTFSILKQKNGSPLAVVDAIAPTESPFDDVPRDKLRSVAARVQTPYFILTNFRRAVTYRTEAVTKRLPDEDQVVGWQQASDARTTDDTKSSGTQLGLVTALSHATNWLNIESAMPVSQHVRDASAFFSERVLAMFDDLTSCTESHGEQRDATLRLGTSILAYVLMHVRNPDAFDRLAIPYGTRSSDLMLDLVGAYFRQARRKGYAMLPHNVSDVRVLADKQEIFRMTLADLIHFLHRFDPERLTDSELHRAVDAILQRCARIARTSVPTIDALDLALRAVAHVRQSLPERISMLEIGQTQGLASVRQMLMSHSTPCDARVYARTSEDERSIVLRSSGRLDAATDVQILRDTRGFKRPWDLVVATSSDTTERHRIKLLLERMPMSADGCVVLFLPLSVLHDERYAGMRHALASRFAVEWVIMSDVEALAEPDAGVCCIIARNTDVDCAAHATRFVYLRRPIAAFFPSSKASRDLEQARLKSLDAFVAYLDASERGKLNDEAVVRMVRQVHLSDAGSWEDYLVPPDVLSSILHKTLHRMRPLATIADVGGGLRTGANDVFAPDTHDIATNNLEAEYWQRTRSNGTTVDATILTSADDIESIMGLPRSDRRLLLLPQDRNAMTGTNVLTRIERAEREGVHLRASIRNRDSWWHLPAPSSAHLIIPKQQYKRWIVQVNTIDAYATDAFIGITLHREQHRDAIAMWMNSTLGLFCSEIMRLTDNVADITVRDAQEFPIPDDAILNVLHDSNLQSLLRRPIETLEDEFGASSSDTIRPETIRRDRRKLDAMLMLDVFGLTDEEQRWVYRFTYAWWSRPSNVRHLTNTLAYELERDHKLRPLTTWYAPYIDQLPEANRRSLRVESGITRAEVDGTMFGWRVKTWKGARPDIVIECASQEEAECIAHLVGLGKLQFDVPTDAILISEILPKLRHYATDLNTYLTQRTAHFPEDLRPALERAIKEVMS